MEVVNAFDLIVSSHITQSYVLARLSPTRRYGGYFDIGKSVSGSLRVGATPLRQELLMFWLVSSSTSSLSMFSLPD